MVDAANASSIVKESAKKMEKAVEATKKEFQNMRTGRASIALVEGVMVDYYNTPTPLKNVANIMTPDARTIAIQPWEVSLIPEIEKAIQKSDLGLTPTNDGKVVRITIPPLTEERRDDLTRVVRKVAEEGRVGVRTARHEGIDQIKKLEKDKELPEDVSKALQKDVQKETDKYVAQIDESLQHKEEEIHKI